MRRVRVGSLRISYWAVDPVSGARVELLAQVEQDAQGRFAPVFTTDARAIDGVLELRDGASWREARARRIEPSAEPRVLPAP
jgi:hypothetical protein